MKIKKNHILLVVFLAGVISIGIAGQIDAYKPENAPLTNENTKDINTIKSITKDPIKQYILEKALENDLDPLEIMSIIDCESKFNPNAIGINANRTIDVGIAQFNSIHIKSGFISLECASNAQCAIDKMIAKRLADGNFNAWTCSK